ncbi:MAG: ABC transporter permease [Alphaproteobacteria bacterium]
MTLADALRAALTAIRVNVMRSVLTALGIIIGVAAVIVMISVGAGAEQRVAEVIRSLGSNLILVQNGYTSSAGARLGRGSRRTVTYSDAIAIQNEVPTVIAAVPIVRGNGQIIYGNQNWATSIEGVTPEYREAREWDVSVGRWFTGDEVRRGAKVVVLGATVARNLFPDQNPIGQTVRLVKVPLMVVGVLEAKGESLRGSDQDDIVMVPVTTAKSRLIRSRRHAGDVVDSIFVKARSSEAMETAVTDIRSLLRQRHRLRATANDDFFIRNLTQILSARADSSRVMTLLLAAVASVSLIVGGIGIMNIMLVSVTERTREIGLRMAIGARRRDILRQFLIEAVTLSLIGGLIGVVLGIGVSIAFATLGRWPSLIRVDSILLAFGFAGVIGVFFGYYPARKAARLNPIDALRYE